LPQTFGSQIFTWKKLRGSHFQNRVFAKYYPGHLLFSWRSILTLKVVEQIDVKQLLMRFNRKFTALPTNYSAQKCLPEANKAVKADFQLRESTEERKES
jgi:anti-sigma-K factor RskA